MNQNQIKHAELLREAFNEYLVHVHELPLNPGGKLLSYDFDFINGRKWHTPLAVAMVQCDLRELTNLINGWNDSLCRWHDWSMVLDNRKEQEAWDLQNEFIDSLAHECLLMPVSIRDTITSVGTAAFHQIHLSIDRSYRDYLEGDPKTPKDKPKLLSRKQKEKLLSQLVQVWPNSTKFIEALCAINMQDYIVATRNYRNLAAHSIGPRLGIGHTRTVTRCVKQAQALEQVDDGSYVFKDIQGKLAVSYGFGGTPPLDLETVRAANLGQYEKARSCYIEYRALLEAAVEEIKPIESAT